MSEAKQATDPKDLERQIMSHGVPKNEREWWAQREIARLRSAIEAIERIAFVTIDQYQEPGAVADIRHPSAREQLANLQHAVERICPECGAEVEPNAKCACGHVNSEQVKIV